MDTPDDAVTASHRVSDPQALTALAHPVRLGIIEQLSLNGSMTATELAEALDETPANCSWHLRKLAACSFVEEDPDAASGRRRPWRMNGIGFRMLPDEGPEARIAGRGLRRVLLQRFLDRYLASADRLEEVDRAAFDASFQVETATYLTLQELTDLGEELQRVANRFVARIEHADRRPEGSRLVELVAWGIPVDVAGGAQR